MQPNQLKDALDKAEMIGFKRGVLTIITQLLEELEKSGGTTLEYKSIKKIYDEYSISLI